MSECPTSLGNWAPPVRVLRASRRSWLAEGRLRGQQGLRGTCHEVGYELRCYLQNVIFCDFNVLEETLADHYIDITDLNIQRAAGARTTCSSPTTRARSMTPKWARAASSGRAATATSTATHARSSQRRSAHPRVSSLGRAQGRRGRMSALGWKRQLVGGRSFQHRIIGIIQRGIPLHGQHSPWNSSCAGFSSLFREMLACLSVKLRVLLAPRSLLKEILPMTPVRPLRSLSVSPDVKGCSTAKSGFTSRRPRCRQLPASSAA